MHAEVVEPVPGQAVIDARGERVGCVVSVVEVLIKAAKNGSHRQVEFPVAVNCVRVDQVGLVVTGEHEVTGPEVPVEEAGLYIPALIILLKLLNHLLEVFFPPAVPAAAFRSDLNLWQEPLVDVEIGPRIIPGVILHQGLSLVVIDKAKLVVGLLVQPCHRAAQVGLAAGAFVEPVQDQVGVPVDDPVVEWGRGVDGLAQRLEPVDFVTEVVGRVVRLDLDEIPLSIGSNLVGFVDVAATNWLATINVLDWQLAKPLVISTHLIPLPCVKFTLILG